MQYKTPEPRPLRTFVLALAPLVVIGFMVGGKIVPGVGAQVGMAAGAVAALLLAMLRPHWGSLAGRPHVVLSALAWLMLLVVGGVMGVLHFHTESGSSWCGDTPLLKNQEVCRGRDHSLLQGRLSYSEASGPADTEKCRALKKELAEEKPLADLPDDREWHRQACPNWPDGPWTCVAKERVSSGHDTDRMLYGFSSDCRRGRAWVSVNVTFKEMPKKLAEMR
jgi:hypothetical protein